MRGVSFKTTNLIESVMFEARGDLLRPQVPQKELELPGVAFVVPSPQVLCQAPPRVFRCWTTALRLPNAPLKRSSGIPQVKCWTMCMDGWAPFAIGVKSSNTA
jgi:hypothetical protein